MRYCPLAASKPSLRFSMLIVLRNKLCRHLDQLLTAGGKPSTRLPPGGLVERVAEYSNNQECRFVERHFRKSRKIDVQDLKPAGSKPNTGAFNQIFHYWDSVMSKINWIMFKKSKFTFHTMAKTAKLFIFLTILFETDKN